MEIRNGANFSAITGCNKYFYSAYFNLGRNKSVKWPASSGALKYC